MRPELRATREDMTLPPNNTVIVTAQFTIQWFAHNPGNSVVLIQIIPACIIQLYWNRTYAPTRREL